MFGYIKLRKACLVISSCTQRVWLYQATHNVFVYIKLHKHVWLYQATHNVFGFIKLHTCLVISGYTQHVWLYQATHNMFGYIRLHTTCSVISSYTQHVRFYQDTHNVFGYIKLHTTCLVISSYTQHVWLCQATHNVFGFIKLHTCLVLSSYTHVWLYQATHNNMFILIHPFVLCYSKYKWQITNTTFQYLSSTATHFGTVIRLQFNAWWRYVVPKHLGVDGKYCGLLFVILHLYVIRQHVPWTSIRRHYYIYGVPAVAVPLLYEAAIFKSNSFSTRHYNDNVTAYRPCCIAACQVLQVWQCGCFCWCVRFVSYEKSRH
jgi:hypothetical protein